MASELAQFGLTRRQEEFVRHFVEGGHRADSVIKAGYSVGTENPVLTADIVAHRLLRTPTVMAALRYQTALMLQHEAPKMLGVIRVIAYDVGAPKGVRLDAAKTWLDRAGYIAPKARDASREGSDRPLNEYSVDELRKLVDDLERKRGDEANLVTFAPPTGAEPSQVTDMLD
jgi:hypothetical protein